MPKHLPTPSFVCELPLVVSSASEGVLLSRLDAARQIYNACLGEALRRVRLIRQSKDFNQARSLKPNKPERKVLFKRARERYKFSEYALHSYSTKVRHSWIGDHIDSNTAQKLATRAYFRSRESAVCELEVSAVQRQEPNGLYRRQVQ